MKVIDKMFNIGNTLLTIAALFVAVALFVEFSAQKERTDMCQVAVEELQSNLEYHVIEALRYKHTVNSNRDRLDELSQSPVARRVVTHK